MDGLKWIILICFVGISSALDIHPKGPQKPEAPDCAVDSDGLYPADCKRFYRCINKTMDLVECPGELLVHHSWCDYPEWVPPPCGFALDCSKLPDGNYPDVQRKCKYYFSCAKGEFYGFTKCMGATVYNVRNDRCDWKHKVLRPCGTLTPKLMDQIN